MNIYIAGPMTGRPNFNRAEFMSVAHYFESKCGAVVLNPAILPDGLNQREYMDICFSMIRCCGHLFMLDGWKDSLGAIAEHAYAKKLGLKIIYQDLPYE